MQLRDLVQKDLGVGIGLRTVPFEPVLRRVDLGHRDERAAADRGL